MNEVRRRSVWFYLFGCTPTTAVLLFVLVALVLVPMLFSVWAPGGGAGSRSTIRLPSVRDGGAWVLLSGERWGRSTDTDGNGVADCFRAGGALGDLFAAPGYERACSRHALGLVARLRGIRPLDDAFRDALTEAAAFKHERGWLPLSVTDTDGDGSADCVVVRDPMGLALRRSGATCPYDERSLPAPLESHTRETEFDALLQLERRIRQSVESGESG
jgi:hypothetical protein